MISESQHAMFSLLFVHIFYSMTDYNEHIQVRIHKSLMDLVDKMIMLRKTFREALKEDELQEAFDELWPT
jgi:hypothetical protein